MNISTFDLPKHILEVLKKLPLTEFTIVELSKLTKENLNDAEIIFTSLTQAKKFQVELNSSSAVVLVYSPKTDVLSSLFKTAKEAGAFTLISDEDLKQLETTLHEAHQEVIQKRKHQFKKGKTIGFLSTKGGVGKTFLSHELAHQLSSYVYNDALLIDAAVPFGSSRSLLNLNATTSWQVLRPLLKNGKDLTQSRFKAQVTKTQHQFDVLSAPNAIQELPLSSAELSHLIQVASQNYALTLVDLPSITGDQLDKYSSMFDLIVWVFTPDANSIIQTLEFQKTVDNKNVMFVCNMVEPILDASLLSAVEQKLKPAKLITIENDQEAVKFHQRSFKLFSDESLVLTQQLKSLAKEVFFELSKN